MLPINTPPVLTAATAVSAAPVAGVPPALVVSTAPLAPEPTQEEIRRVAAIYLRRRERIDHPKGEFDKASRWYPDACEKLDMTQYRGPSGAYPLSYMHACRTIKHCARLGGVPDHALEVRRQAKLIVNEAALLGWPLSVLTAQILATKP